MASALAGGMLLLCGQLSLLIWYVRSRSAGDFDGRYRIWIWASAAWLFSSAIVFTDALQAIIETTLWIRTDISARTAAFSWLLPMVAAGSSIFGHLDRDMRGCRSSLVVFRMAVCCYLAYTIVCLTTVGAPVTFANQLLQIGLLTIANSLSFLCLLLHARYVIYDNAEPPPKISSRIAGWLGRIRLPRLRFSLGLPKWKFKMWTIPKLGWIKFKPKKRRAEKSAEYSPSDEESLQTKEENASTEPAPKRSAKADASGNSSKAKRKINRENQETQRSSSPEKKSAQPAPSQPASSNDTEEELLRRIDPGTGELDLKGLSKRQRRQLRKLQRERERAGQN